MHARTLAASLLLVAAAPGVAGADTGRAPEPLPPEPPPVQYRNPAMRISGIVLTVLGGVTLAGGVGFVVYGAGTEGDKAPIAAAILSISLISSSLLFAGIGIPLWVVGSQPPKNAAARDPWVPRVSVGAGSGSLRWSF